MYHVEYVPNGYYCTSAYQLSVANEEILPQATGREYREISLYNKDDLTITFTTDTGQVCTQFLPAGVGFNITPETMAITSIKVTESSKTFILMGAY